MIKRNTLNFVIDLLTAALFVGIVATGIIIRYVLPPGTGHSHVLWDFGRHDWGGIHFWLAVAAGVLVLVHVALHWQWVCVTSSRLAHAGNGEQAHPSRLTRSVAGGLVVLVLIGFFAGVTWIAQTNITTTAGGEETHVISRSHNEGQENSPQLRGSMSLAEASVVTRLPVTQLRQRLGISADTPPDRRLGELSREVGLSMREAREKLLTDEQ